MLGKFWNIPQRMFLAHITRRVIVGYSMGQKNTPIHHNLYRNDWNCDTGSHIYRKYSMREIDKEFLVQLSIEFSS